MAVTFTDASANTQVLAASNSAAVELGAATPTSSLSVGGRQFLNGSILTPGTIPSGGLNRITGSVTIQSEVETNVNIGTLLAGLGTISGGFITSFSSYGFNCAYSSNIPSQTATFQYSVI